MSPKRLAVVGTGPGKHSYRISVTGSISKATHAGGNDTTMTGLSGDPFVDGTVWNWNADTYTYTGEIRDVEASGDVSVHFPDGAFVDDGWLAVTGQGQGRHDYAIATDSGDIEPHPGSTGGGETDHGGRSSESDGSPDNVSGFVVDQNADGHEVGTGVPIQSISVDGGHVEVGPNTGEIFDTGEAAMVFFYMGDSRFTTFFQEGTRLNAALNGYDEKVLLKHNLTPESVLSTAAHNNADTVCPPTRHFFERELRRLTNEGYTVDLYVFSHGYRRGAFRMSTGSHGTVDLFDTSDVRDLQSSIADEIPLRMVYQVNCWGSNMNSAWRDVGAKAVAGSRYVNFFPTQFGKFARRWRSGDDFQQALNKANNAASRTAVHTALLADAAATSPNQWGGCPLFKTVLSNSPCARDYYINRWGHNSSEWDSSLSGKHNINRASEKLIAGDPSLDSNSYY